MANRIKLSFSAISAFILASIVSLNANAKSILVGDKAPDFVLQTLAGKPIKLSDYKGKQAVYLVFWASWCSACKQEIPGLKALNHKLGDKIKLIAINTGIGDSELDVKNYQKKHALDYTIVLDDDNEVTQSYDVVGTPTQLIVDINGIVRYRSAKIPSDLNQHVDALLVINKS